MPTTQELDFLKGLGKSIARGVPQLATGFVDLAALPFTMSGLTKPEDVFMSTDYLTKKGLLPPPQTGLLNQGAEIASSMVNPASAAKLAILGGIGAIKNVGKPLAEATKRMSRQEAESLGYWHPISKTKLNKPFHEMTSKVIPFENVKTPQIISPEALLGKGGVTTKGDRTNIGLLTEIDGVKLKENVPLHGGARFADFNKDIWASNAGQVKTIANKSKGLLDAGYDPTLIYTTSSHDALRFNTMLTDGFLQDIKAVNLPKKIVQEFDADLRKIRPEWKGIESPEARLQLSTNGTLRTYFNELGGQTKYREKGFPDITPIKKAITDPNLIDTPNLYSGYRIGQVDPNNMIIKDSTQPHPTYNTSIGGTQLGELGVQLPHSTLFPDFYKQRRLRGEPVSGDAYAVERGYPTQIFNQQWLDSVAPAYEKELLKQKELADKAYYLKTRGLLGN